MDATLEVGVWKAVREAVAMESMAQWKGGDEAKVLHIPLLAPENQGKISIG
jgi:hypothetical protein